MGRAALVVALVAVVGFVSLVFLGNQVNRVLSPEAGLSSHQPPTPTPQAWTVVPIGKSWTNGRASDNCNPATMTLKAVAYRDVDSEHRAVAYQAEWTVKANPDPRVPDCPHLDADFEIYDETGYRYETLQPLEVPLDVGHPSSDLGWEIAEVYRASQHIAIDVTSNFDPVGMTQDLLATVEVY